MDNATNMEAGEKVVGAAPGTDKPKITRKRLTDDQHEERAKAKLAAIAEKRKERLRELIDEALTRLQEADALTKALGTDNACIRAAIAELEKA